MRFSSVCFLALSNVFLFSCSQPSQTFSQNATAAASAKDTEQSTNFQDNAKSLVIAFVTACVDTGMDQGEVSMFAEKNGWSRLAESALAGSGRKLWAKSGPLQLEARDGVEHAENLFVCSVSTSGDASNSDHALLETKMVRRLLEESWELDPIERLPSVEVFENLPDRLMSSNGIPNSFEQYKFRFKPKDPLDVDVEFKFGYLWAGGEHRLNASKQK